HQPDFASFILEPNLDEAGIAQRLTSFDPRYFTTYYAIDTVNYRPVNTASAIDTIEGPYLPMIIQELAGLPLDASFAEQKKIFQRCEGMFYACAGGAEARRFNRLLIDAGLIKGLRWLPTSARPVRECAPAWRARRKGALGTSSRACADCARLHTSVGA